VATLISIIGKEALARYAFWIGKTHQSGSVIADGWHHRSDAVSSVIILAGIFLGSLFWWIDAALAILVAMMIFWAAYGVIRDAAAVIIGEEPSRQ
jgi:divalent metal cation (Fe/Co/Zn/Cd) transporter